MLEKKSFLLMIISAAFFAIGCKVEKGDQGLTGPQGPDGPSLSGKISGFVELYYENGNILSDHSGVTVQANENPNFTASSNADGKWIINNVITGIYTISLMKEGFGTMKILNVQFAGGGQAYLGKTALVEKPSYRVTSLNVTISSNGFHPRGTISSPGDTNFGATIFLFFGEIPGVSSDPENYKYWTTANANPGSTFYEVNISLQSLHSFINFPSGTNVFVAAYSSSSYGGFTSYPDTATGRLFITSISDSSKNDSFIMP